MGCSTNGRQVLDAAIGGWVLEQNAPARRLYESVAPSHDGVRRVFSEASRETLDELQYRIECPGIERPRHDQGLSNGHD